MTTSCLETAIYYPSPNRKVVAAGLSSQRKFAPTGNEKALCKHSPHDLSSWAGAAL